MADLRDIVARILTQEGAVCGGGFLAPRGQGTTRAHVITCAHVVNAALGEDRENQDRPEDKVRLRLPGSNKPVWGDIIEWHPPRRYEELDKEPVSDIAVLDIGEWSGGTGPEIARTAVPNGSRFRAFGFPGWEQGMPIDGEVLERDNGGWLHVRPIADRDYFAEEGFSGTPVLDYDGSEVFGVITAVSPDAKRQRAFIIPPDILRRAWPLLAQPYRGLSAFREQEADCFFGRDQFIEMLLQRVRDQSVTLVFGASGSGKSSVVFAGLVPRMRKLGWSIAHFRPGDRPLHALAHALALFLEPTGSPAVRIKCAREWASLLAKEATAIHDVAAAIETEQAERRLLLIADQFEELFTLCTDDAERIAFADVIHEIASTHRDPAPVRMVATLRADFSGYVSGDPILGPAFHGRWLDLPAMDRYQIAEAITRPAAELGVRFETGLSESILATMLRGTGLLPLMEFALDQLWRRQAGRCLRVQDYEAIGGLEGALAKHADDMLAALKARGHAEDSVRRTLVQLVRVALPGEGEDTKRQRTRAELGEELWPIVQKLADARLVVTSRDPAGNAAAGNGAAGNETADIVHEALIRNWGQLRQWLDDDRRFLLWRQITEAHAKR
jgi:Trypsin-like peptidase domain